MGEPDGINIRAAGKFLAGATKRSGHKLIKSGQKGR